MPNNDAFDVKDNIPILSSGLKLIEEKKPDDGTDQVCVLLEMAPSLIGPRLNK